MEVRTLLNTVEANKSVKHSRQKNAYFALAFATKIAILNLIHLFTPSAQDRRPTLYSAELKFT